MAMEFELCVYDTHSCKQLCNDRGHMRMGSFTGNY